MKFRFKQTDEVAHIHNLSQKMIVVGAKFRNIEQSTGEFKDKDNPKEGFRTEKKRKITGISVEWWNSDGELLKNVFHSHSLVPWNIAVKGEEEAKAWLSEQINYKMPEN